MADRYFSHHHVAHVRIFVAGGAIRARITATYASCGRVTDFITGTEQAVIRTGGIIGRVHALVVNLVTGINGAVHPVVTIDRGAVYADAVHARFRAVAVHAVVAEGVIRYIDTCISIFIAEILGAVEPVVTVNRGAVYADAVHAGFNTGAVQQVITVRINRTIGRGFANSISRITCLTGRTHYRVINAPDQWAATVDGAEVTVVAIQRCAGLATIDRVTCFLAVADIAVVTEAIIWCVDTCISIFIAGVLGAVDPVITVDRGAGNTDAVYAGFNTGAEQKIITVRIFKTFRFRTVRICLVVYKVAVVVKTSISQEIAVFTRRRLTGARIINC